MQALSPAASAPSPSWATRPPATPRVDALDERARAIARAHGACDVSDVRAVSLSAEIVGRRSSEARAAPTHFLPRVRRGVARAPRAL